MDNVYEVLCKFIQYRNESPKETEMFQNNFVNTK